MTRGPSPNQRINASVRLVTPRACARVVPIRPARYAQRWPDDKTGNVF
jgi:hypothetical protein